MNTNKILPVDAPTESCLISVAYEGSIERLLSINTPMTHLSPLNMIDTMPVTQQDQTALTGEDDVRPALHQQIQESRSMDKEDNDAFVEMHDLEKFCADERWKQGRFTQSEQVLFVQNIKSILDDASKSASLHPTRTNLELEYYNLTKLLELV